MNWFDILAVQGTLLGMRKAEMMFMNVSQKEDGMLWLRPCSEGLYRRRWKWTQGCSEQPDLPGPGAMGLLPVAVQGSALLWGRERTELLG